MHELIRMTYCFSRNMVAKVYDRFYGIQTESEQLLRARAICNDGVRYEPTPY